jgi:hypothetical protein
LARLAEKQRSHQIAQRNWNPADQPDWLNETAYDGKIHPRLSKGREFVEHDAEERPVRHAPLLVTFISFADNQLQILKDSSNLPMAFSSVIPS